MPDLFTEPLVQPSIISPPIAHNRKFFNQFESVVSNKWTNSTLQIQFEVIESHIHKLLIIFAKSKVIS